MKKACAPTGSQNGKTEQLIQAGKTQVRDLIIISAMDRKPVQAPVQKGDVITSGTVDGNLVSMALNIL